MYENEYGDIINADLTCTNDWSYEVSINGKYFVTTKSLRHAKVMVNRYRSVKTNFVKK